MGIHNPPALARGIGEPVLVSDVDAARARALANELALDRHWRNARTAGSHNPWVFKARIVGDHAVNGVEPPRVWAIGATRQA